MRRPNLQIQGELDALEEMLDDVEVQGRVERDDRQVRNARVNVAPSVQSQVENRAVRGGLDLSAQATRRIEGAGQQFLDGLPHGGALRQLPEKAKLLRLLSVPLLARAGQHNDFDLPPPFQFGGSRARAA